MKQKVGIAMEDKKIDLTRKNEAEIIDAYYKMAKEIELQKFILEECKNVDKAKDTYIKILGKKQ